jgi:hypothetical protein
LDIRRWWDHTAGIDEVVLLVMELVAADVVVVYVIAKLVEQAKEGRTAAVRREEGKQRRLRHHFLLRRRRPRLHPRGSIAENRYIAHRGQKGHHLGALYQRAKLLDEQHGR